jgi:hypothetical protein
MINDNLRTEYSKTAYGWIKNHYNNLFKKLINIKYILFN